MCLDTNILVAKELFKVLTVFPFTKTVTRLYVKIHALWDLINLFLFWMGGQCLYFWNDPSLRGKYLEGKRWKRREGRTREKSQWVCTKANKLVSRTSQNCSYPSKRVFQHGAEFHLSTFYHILWYSVGKPSVRKRIQRHMKSLLFFSESSLQNSYLWWDGRKQSDRHSLRKMP